MSCTPFVEMSEIEKSQTAVNLAILVLHDCKLEITAENINKVLKAVGIKVESYWADIYCDALKGQNIESFFTVSAAAPAQTSQAAAAQPAKEEKKAEKPKTVEEEENIDMGGLFD